MVCFGGCFDSKKRRQSWKGARPQGTMATAAKMSNGTLTRAAAVILGMLNLHINLIVCLLLQLQDIC